MIAQSNLVIFNNDSVKETFDCFLNSIKNKSESMYNNYKSTLVDFFKVLLNKDITQITWEDINRIRVNQVGKYQTHLLKVRELSEGSINTKMSHISVFWGYINRQHPEIPANVVKVDKLVGAGKTWGALREDELQRLYEYCEGLVFKGHLQRMFFETTIITAIRSGALLKMKWSNLQVVEDDRTGEEVCAIVFLKDKGTVDSTPLPEWFYNKLISMKGCQHDDDLVFDIDIRTLRSTLKSFCDKDGIKESRNIQVHSLKKTSGDIIYKETGGDIVATARQLHHKTIETTYQRYLSKNEQLSNRANLKAFKENGLDKFEDIKAMSNEELLEAIKRSGNFIIETILKNR